MTTLQGGDAVVYLLLFTSALTAVMCVGAWLTDRPADPDVDCRVCGDTGGDPGKGEPPCRACGTDKLIGGWR